MIEAFAELTILPVIFIFAAAAMASYVLFDFAGTLWSSYRDRYLAETEYELDNVLLQLPANRILNFSIALSAVVFAVCMLSGLILSGDGAWHSVLVMALLAGCAVFPLPRLILRYLKIQRTRKFNEQLEDVLMNMSGALKAGFSINQAIDEVASRPMPPISVEFRLLAQECRLGVTLDKALRNMEKRVDSPDFELVSMAVITARQTGGELTGTLERLAGLMRERVRINGKINSLTAMGRLQASIIGIMPFLLLLGMYQVSPSLMSGLFDSWAGYFMIFAVIVLDVTGFMVIKRIITIDI